jgi:hypothetical protein
MQTSTQPIIKASELRICNWVLHEGTITPIQISAKSFLEVENYIALFEPIPLTPEILEKCNGFQPAIGGTYYLPNENWKADFMGLEPCPSGGYYRLNEEYAEVGDTIQYLHQLQNLYFALTGTELEINL